MAHDHAQLDTVIEELVRGEALWAATALVRRREILDQIRALTGMWAQAWVDAAVGIKQLDPASPLVGEEWTSGPYAVINGAESLASSLRALEADTSPIDGYDLSTVAGGRTAVQVMPHDTFEKLLLNGFSAQVWLRPGVGPQQARDRAGLAQRTPGETGGVGVVLGAGNIASIAPLDVLYELYAHNRVVILKLNPIMDPMLPVFREIFRPLIDMGAVRIVTGGADVGSHLVNHPDIAHVHMTGSARTHDAIVWGTGDVAAERKAANEPLLDTPISSELGGVSPVIAVPGDWDDADLKFQAEHVATQRLHNGGYNCVAAQVLVVSSDWDRKDEFIAAVHDAIAQAPARASWYPGSDDRIAAAVESYPDAETLSGRVMIPGVEAGSPALHTEYFSPVLAVTELPGDAQEFLTAAVDFANNECAGTLGANVIVHPDTMAAQGSSFEDAIAALEYGTIAINAWTGVGYLTARATWGAFPGHTLDDVQSGIGVVHNGLLLDDTERTVVRGPFRPSPRSIMKGELTLTPRPPWFVTNRTAATTGQRLTAFAAEPSWAKLPGIFASALRG